MTRAYLAQPHDFDFLIGRWNAAGRRLHQRLVGSDDWDEFPATSQAWVHLDGCISVDELRSPTKGFNGFTLRTLDHAAKHWSIYWINSASGHLFAPVHGGFAGDRGEFYGDDTDDGRPVRVRFIWTKLGRDAARWEQAFSLDGSAWETNWVMEFSRAPE